jgi:hypothetical protein
MSSMNTSMYEAYHRFLNLTVPDLKIIGVRRRVGQSDRTLCHDYARPYFPCNIAKNFGFEKLTGFLNNKPDQI